MARGARNGWQVRVVEHGTGKTVAVPRFGRTTWQRRLDEVTTATTSWAASEAPRIHKWEHELEIWRERDLVWAGPIVTPRRTTNAPIAVTARDLGMRLERLFVARDRSYTQQDLGLIFGQLASDALRDTGIGLDVVTYPTGTLGDREYVAANYERLADKLRELARTDVDYTFVGRQMIVGGSAIPGAPTWKLQDAMVDSASDLDDGLVQVNDAVVIGTKPTIVTENEDGTTTTTTGELAVGRYQDAPSIGRVGPLQLRYNEPDIKDPSSAGVAARNRVGFNSAALPDLAVRLKEGEYRPGDLVCGALVEVALSDRILPYGQEGAYVLETVDGEITASGQAVVVVGLTQQNSTE